MFAAIFLSGNLLLATQDPLPQVPASLSPPASSAVQATEPTVLSDVISDGLRIDEIAADFVETVAAPSKRRGLARWYDSLCVGVANVPPTIAQPLIDHITSVAIELGIRTRQPGCSPNVVIVFADSGTNMATALVAQDFRAFHLGVGGMDRGRVALGSFQTIDRPVRWWHVSMPIDYTGEPAIRMPGDWLIKRIGGEGIVNRGRSITDSLNKVIVVVDINEIQDVNLAQLGDYLAMVTLAQVDLESPGSDGPSILNLFEEPAQTAGLSEWDRAYLDTLYAAFSERVNPHRQAADLARRVTRDRVAEAAPERAD